MLISPNYSDYWQTPETYINRFEDYVTNAVSTDEGINHSEELLKEAVAVGASLVPVYWLTSRALRRVTQNWSPENAILVNVAVCAGIFHVICEETGVNNWYLSNSIASKKAKKKYGRKPVTYSSVETPPSHPKHNFKA
jgi:hypothetical protein